MKNTILSERICVDCHTTKTPMWRGGPAGPRSLCNACGIKHRKRNRLLLGPASRVLKKSERSSDESSGGGMRRPWNMREEEEAAILLMALSCDSVYV